MGLIDKTFDMSKIHLFKSGGSKSLLSEKTMPKLKKAIKENIKPPSKNKKVYTIEFSLNIDDIYPLRIICGQYTLTSKLALVMEDDDIALTIEYTQDELKKYGFQKEHIKKIIKAIKEQTATFTDLTDNITHILKVTK